METSTAAPAAPVSDQRWVSGSEVRRPARVASANPSGATMRSARVSPGTGSRMRALTAAQSRTRQAASQLSWRLEEIKRTAAASMARPVASSGSKRFTRVPSRFPVLFVSRTSVPSRTRSGMDGRSTLGRVLRRRAGTSKARSPSRNRARHSSPQRNRAPSSSQRTRGALSGSTSRPHEGQGCDGSCGRAGSIR